MPVHTVMPPQEATFALSLKQPEALDRRHGGQAREVGNQSVRLAMASWWAQQRDSTLPFLGNLDEADREELLAQAVPDEERESWPHVAFSDEAIRTSVATTIRSQRSRHDRLAAIWSYIDSRPGSFTARDVPPPVVDNHDVTLTQAFGRNTIPDRELAEVGVQRARYSSDEAFFTEYLAGFDPGESNRALARAVAAQLDDPTRRIEQIPQWEVAYALWQDDPVRFTRHRDVIHTLYPRANAYRTYEVKQDSLAVMRRKGLYHAHELAPPDMLARALRILGELGVEADALLVEVPYDRRSVQLQTRSPGWWVGRETLTRLEHVLRGRVKF